MENKILVIDDDSERLTDLTEFLRRAGYDFEIAAAPDAVEQTVSNAPDLVIARLENGNVGISRQLKSGNWLTVPVLLLGEAAEDDSSVVAELNDGANGYLPQSFDPIRLATLIAFLIECERMEKIVRKKDSRFLSLIEYSTDLITVLALDGTILYESPSAKQLLGRDPQNDKGINALDHVHPKDRRKVVSYLNKATPHPPLSASIEYRYRHQDGSWCVLESVGRTVEDSSQGTVIVVNSRDVSARRKSELALRESEEKFRAQYKNLPLPTYTWKKTGDDFTLTDFNDAADQATHGKVKDLLGMNATTIYSHAPRVIKDIERCFKERAVIKDELSYTYRTTGETRHLEVDFIYVPPDLVMAHARDITDTRHSEQSLEASENRFQLAARATNDALWDWDMKTDVIWLNDSYYEMFGYQHREDQAGFNLWKENVHPEDRERIVESLHECIAAGRVSWSEEYRHIRRDGTYADIYDRGYVMRDRDGKPVRMIGAMMDVSDRKRVENAVLFQALLLDTVQQAVIATNLRGEVTYWNGYAEKIFGWKAAAALNRSLMDLIVPETSRRTTEKLFSKLLQGKSWTGEMILQRRDKTLFPAQMVNSPVLDEQGERIGMLGILTDITDRKLAEKENLSLNTQIQTQRHRLNTIIANIPGVVWEAKVAPGDSDGFVNFVSDYVEKMIGYTAAEWSSEPNFWLKIMHPEDREHAELEVRTLVETTGKGVQQYRWIAKDGGIVWVETQVILVTDENGEPFSLRGISIDVSERKVIEEALQKSEDQLRQSQKLESVGRLAGGIAHDFNNMLTAINGYSDLILRELGDDDSLRNKVMEIKKAGERSAALTHQLLAFSRRQVLQPKLIDLNKSVKEMSQLLYRLIGEDIQLVISLSPSPSCVEADPGQLSQVIMNLVVNARDAMPQGGELIVKTEKIRFEEEPVAQFSPQRTGDFVMLSVIDTGTGIEDKILEQIFEPFFTTKQVGVGTGLGLSTVYGIVKQSGGYIWVNSEVGKGTEFKIYLPYAEEKAVEKKVRKAPEQFPHGSETILLVEDEEMVRSLTRRILEVCGYTVIEARNGIEALKICEDMEYHIDLLMTDVVMPQMSGRELSEKMSAIRPQTRTLFTSGYMNDRTMRLGVREDEVDFIQKPFAPDVLARKVREMLDRKSIKE